MTGEREAYLQGQIEQLQARLAAVEAERDKLKAAWARADNAIEQVLGRALGYPAYGKDFPDAADDVCVGDHVAASLADEIVERLVQAERERGEAKLQAEDYGKTLEDLCNFAWKRVYSEERTDWEYPGQAIRHLADETISLRERLRQCERGRAELLQRYLDSHCANSDAEGMSALCECKLCQDTRAALNTEARQ